ncbi:hypothetical protein HY498_01715 [Candidatus Woesearchaeota archaeon]|nr:hypothetical protein [Candidatus Woesearchaeota archaeon]
MALTLPKIIIILLALLNLIFIGIATALGKSRLAISLAVVEAIIVTSSSYFD